MVSEPDTGGCASKEVEPRRGMDTRQCASEEVSFERGRHKAVCQQRRWTLKKDGLEGPTLIGKGNDYQQGR